MSAFLIAHSTIKNPEKFQDYAKAVPSTLTAFGGEVALKGKVAEVMTGKHDFNMVGVLKFPNRSSAKNWYQSPAYQALIPNRDEAADIVIISYDEP